MKSLTPLLLIVVLVTAGCKKNSFFVTERENPQGKALVKMALFSTTLNTVNVLISVNDQRVSNPQPNFNGAYPGGGLNTSGNANSDFLAVDPGEAKFVLDIPNPGTSIPFAKYFEGTTTLEANKRYVFVVCDTGATTTSFRVNADGPKPDSGFSAMIYAHAIPNVPAVDVYKGANATTATILFTNVLYKGSTEYAVFPAVTDSIFIRPAGSPVSTTPIARRGFTFANQRLNVVISRGYNNSTGTNRAPNLSLFYIQ
jgi:hypothetical protein